LSEIFPVLNIVSIVIGLIATFLVIRLYLSYRYRYILTFAFNISLFNIVLILFLPINYLMGHSGTNDQQSFVKYTILFLFILSINIFKYLWAYTFILMVSQVLKENLSKFANLVFLSVSVSTLLVFSGFFFIKPIMGTTNFPRVISEIVTFQAIIIAYAALIFLNSKARKNQSKKRARAFRQYSFPLLFIWSFVLISAGLATFINIPSIVEINIILTTLSFNLNAAFVLKSFIAIYDVNEISGIDKIQDLTEVFNRYQISAREQEIIRLICKGKGNQEIADELFISLATVKDHLYNIFKKTDVKNRTQLSNLFH